MDLGGIFHTPAGRQGPVGARPQPSAGWWERCSPNREPSAVTSIMGAVSKRVEIVVAGVVGGVIAVYVTAAADASGLLVFTAALLGAAGLAGVVVLIRRAVERRKRAAQRLDRIEQLLKEQEEQLRLIGGDVARMHDQLRLAVELVEETSQLVVPDWLRKTETWASKNGWTVTHEGATIMFACDSQPQDTVEIVMPLGSHQQEQATRTALLKHLGYPEPGLLSQIGSMTRVLGRGD